MRVVSLNECLSFSWEFHELHESLLPLSFGAFVTLDSEFLSLMSFMSFAGSELQIRD